jgi:L-aspartate oxidase
VSPTPGPGPRLARSLAAPPPGWTVEADAIVVGSGIAGLTAALELRTQVPRVLLVTKGRLLSGSTVWAQGGIAAALHPTDSPQAHLADTLAAGGGLSDPEAVQVLVTEGPARVRELVARGAVFDKAADGDIALTREGGHRADRIAHAGGDATGAEISRALVAQIEAVRHDPGIEVVENALVLDVLTAAPDPAVVLATGGIGQVFRSSTNPAGATGDGIAAALRAGAVLGDLEFVQFHPTVLWLGSGAKGQLPLISEAVRGEGALLLDVDGHRFMPAVHEMAELAPRDVVAHAIVRQMAATGADNVLLDARHLGREFLRTRFPTINRRLLEADIDWSEEPVPVAPAQHYHSGGVVTDLDGRSSVDGLYAVGEVACTGVHGANRLASNSLSECFVFGRRAALAGLDDPLPTAAPRVPDGVDPAPAPSRDVRAAMWRHAGLERTAVGLRRLLELGHPLARLVAACALHREESRGAHARADHPAVDPALNGRHTVVEAAPRFVEWT